MNIKPRIKKLEARSGNADSVIVVDWGGPTLEVNGETMTREEFERRYPDRTVINWPEDEED